MAEENQQASLRDSPSKGYPRVKTATDSPWGQMVGFFKGLVPVDKLGGPKPPAQEASLLLEPQNPVLSRERELSVTYLVRNNSKKMTRLEFPTSQHIEILTKNASGGVVDRWSDDRAFQKEEGIVVINPQERIEYQEKVSTRDMRVGQAYTIKVSLKTQPDHSITQVVNPR
ncbi:MAG: BsuPI-related putative proteinase inhibitor [bacterium]